MKREFLQNIKIGEQALTKELIDAILDENGRDIDAAKAKFSDYDTIKKQLTDANTAIDGFKAMDVDGIKKAADEWKDKFEQSERDHAAKLADMAFDSLLNTEISALKGKNAKAILANLDLDTLKASKNQSADMKTALATLKESDGYLFDSADAPPPYAGGTGGAPVPDMSKMSYDEACQYLTSNPGAKLGV